LIKFELSEVKRKKRIEGHWNMSVLHKKVTQIIIIAK